MMIKDRPDMNEFMLEPLNFDHDTEHGLYDHIDATE